MTRWRNKWMAGVLAVLVAGLAFTAIRSGWQYGRDHPHVIRRYSGTVDAVKEFGFRNYFGSNVKILVGVQIDGQIDGQHHVTVVCLDGVLAPTINECIGLEKGVRVLVYVRPSGSWGIER